MKNLFILILLIPYIACESPTSPAPEIVQEPVEDPAEEQEQQDIERNDSVAEDEKEAMPAGPAEENTAVEPETPAEDTFTENTAVKTQDSPAEPEETAEPEIIYIDRYSLSGVVWSNPDTLDIENGIVLVNDQPYEMESNVNGEFRINHIIINVDSSDSFLFIGEISNMENLFGIDLNRMDFEELETAVEILRLFPEVGIRDLMEVYN